MPSGKIASSPKATTPLSSRAITNFPLESLKREHFRDSSQQSICPWKGTASYFDLVVNDEVNPGAAWYYPEPKSAAAEIRDHVAFWRGVTVQA